MPLAVAGLVALAPQLWQVAQAVLVVWTLLACLVAHELGHGLAARDAGDRTAMEEGRLSASPWVHLEPVGALLVPALSWLAGTLLGIPLVVGWARPLPVDASCLRQPRDDALRVALAGPLVNLSLGLLSTLALVLLTLAVLPRATPSLSVLPIDWFSTPVLDPAYPLLFTLLTIARWSLLLNAFLVGVNLLPFPFLDGGKALRLVFDSRRLERLQAWLLGLALLLLPTGVLALLLWPVAWLWFAGIRAVGIVTGVPVP